MFFESTHTHTESKFMCIPSKHFNFVVLSLLCAKCTMNSQQNLQQNLTSSSALETFVQLDIEYGYEYVDMNDF